MFDPAGIPVLIEQRLRFFRPHVAKYRLVEWTAETLDAVLRDNPGIRAVVAAGEKPLPPAIASLPSLELLALMGAGYEGIQTEELWARGVAISNTAGSNAEDVADQALALFMALVRRVIPNDRRVREGNWVDAGAILSTPSIRDFRVGVVGMGAIGKALARRFAAFGCELMWYGPRPKPEVTLPRAETVLELARACDVIVLAHRADHTNAGLVDAAVIEALGPKGYLVNVSRGSAVDEPALIAALRSGALAGAALDVFEPEPVIDSRWAGVPNCVLSPHTGGIGAGAWRQAGAMVCENMDRFFSGRPLLTPVTAG